MVLVRLAHLAGELNMCLAIQKNVKLTVLVTGEPEGQDKSLATSDSLHIVRILRSGSEHHHTTSSGLYDGLQMLVTRVDKSFLGVGGKRSVVVQKLQTTYSIT